MKFTFSADEWRRVRDWQLTIASLVDEGMEPAEAVKTALAGPTDRQMWELIQKEHEAASISEPSLSQRASVNGRSAPQPSGGGIFERAERNGISRELCQARLAVWTKNQAIDTPLGQNEPELLNLEHSALKKYPSEEIQEYYEQAEEMGTPLDIFVLRIVKGVHPSKAWTPGLSGFDEYDFTALYERDWDELPPAMQNGG